MLTIVLAWLVTGLVIGGLAHLLVAPSLAPAPRSSELPLTAAGSGTA